jgi:hypothetical protein
LPKSFSNLGEGLPLIASTKSTKWRWHWSIAWDRLASQMGVAAALP